MPYNWTELLQTLAEVNIAILGFSGIMGAVWAGRSISLKSAQLVLFRWMLDYSLIALALCLIPFLVFPFFDSAASGWQFSSIFAVLVTALYLYLSRSFYLNFRQRAQWLDYLFMAGDLVSVTLLILNATGGLFEPGFKAWLLVVMWNMLGAIVGFVRLIYAQWELVDE